VNYPPPPQKNNFEMDVPTFGMRKSDRSEFNIGGDGGERTSVKVHAAPGGNGSLNIFGGYEESHDPMQSASSASYGYSAPSAPFGGRAPL
jgi:hypothetical protein